MSSLRCQSMFLTSRMPSLHTHPNPLKPLGTFLPPSLPPSKLGRNPLFTVPPSETSLNLRNITSTHCYGCQTALPPLKPPQKETNGIISEVPSGTQRFECPSCHNHFCIDCDLFCHETLHNCPGCERAVQDKDINGTQKNGRVNGSVFIDPDAMFLD